MHCYAEKGKKVEGMFTLGRKNKNGRHRRH